MNWGVLKCPLIFSSFTSLFSSGVPGMILVLKHVYHFPDSAFPIRVRTHIPIRSLGNGHGNHVGVGVGLGK
jgi:hypothetical protein